ncbi:unnamed protein product [Bursaphelenchus okinawaensis]|uniref:Uncharacterized protein n=1 Tax=Bursaphelenchus okinawaensis TaxID=465554 RepID=A0A811JRS5_9BILA|nr:unnamed protein product [Bursaphelenchus okinawaensis]CAG9080627.1 unnamed protein product [Bursaphelenchus okinawaensis]
MQIFAERLEPELWCIVIKHVTIVEDTVILAMMNKYFYKLVNMDFKKLCYDHLVYRLEGETWAHAFLKLGGRLFNVIPSNKRFYAENTVCCPFTGKIAIKLEGGYVVLTNIDFALNEVKLLDFTSYTKEVTRVNMINRGKELLVRTHYFILVYDLHSMEVKGKYWQKDKFEFQIVQDGTIFDYYTKKEYKIDAVHPNGTINYVNAYDNSKYIGVHTRDNKLVIINTETDERHEVCKWTLKMVVVYVINENDSVLIQEGLAGRIYSIKQKQFVFNYSDHTWFLNSNAFFDSIGLFTFYNKQSTQWQTVKIDPSLRLSYRYQVYCSVFLLLTLLFAIVFLAPICTPLVPYEPCPVENEAVMKSIDVFGQNATVVNVNESFVRQQRSCLKLTYGDLLQVPDISKTDARSVVITFFVVMIAATTVDLFGAICTQCEKKVDSKLDFYIRAITIILSCIEFLQLMLCLFIYLKWTDLWGVENGIIPEMPVNIYAITLLVLLNFILSFVDSFVFTPRVDMVKVDNLRGTKRSYHLPGGGYETLNE